MSFFTAEHLRAGYGKKNILSDVSFSVEAGSILGILGANGSGKSTLLKAVCGILPHDGTCTLCGERLEGMGARRLAQLCSCIPQRSGISIALTALDVVLMGFNPRLGLLAHPTGQMRARAYEALARVGLGGREHENYLSLSEGQKQLCILARTFVSDAALLLLDEPESALDFRYRYHMLDALRAWVADGTRGAVMTLHDGMLALNYCDVLLLLDDGKALAEVRPRTDPIEKTESVLRMIYGNISLQICRGRDGREHMIMIREDAL